MKLLTTLGAIAASLLLASSALAAPERPALPFHPLSIADVSLPAEWKGVWETTTTVKDCTTLAVLFMDTSTDTLCPETFYTGSDSTFTINCTGTATSTTFDVNCTGHAALSDSCSEDFTIHYTGTRTGDTYSAVSISDITISGTGEECFPVTICQRVETTGTRITSNVDCMVPVEASTWSRLKARYR